MICDTWWGVNVLSKFQLSSSYSLGVRGCSQIMSVKIGGGVQTPLPLCQQLSAFRQPPLPPLSAVVSISPTPPPRSCKNLGSVVALLQRNFEKSHDLKANFEEKRTVLMRLQKPDENFLP